LIVIWAAAMLILMLSFLLVVSLFFVMLYLGLLLLVIYVLARLDRFNLVRVAPDSRLREEKAILES